MKIQDINLKISFSNDVNTTYKIIQFEEELEIIEYQIDMIRNNEVEGLLPLDGRYKDNDLYLYYDITSKQTIADLIKRVELGKKETLDIIEQLIRVILQSENYLLDSSCFLIDDSNIYINPQNMKIHLTYLPVKIQQNINEAVKAYLIQFVVYNGKFKKHETDTIISQILSALKDDQFNLKGFVEKIQKMRLQNQSVSEEEKRTTSKEVRRERPKSLEFMINSNNIGLENSIEQHVQNNELLEVKANKQVDETTYTTKKRFKKSALLLAGISQLVILIIVVLFANKVLEAAGKESSSYAGLGIFILAIEGLIFRKIFNIDNMEEVQVINKKTKNNRTNYNEKTIQKEAEVGQENVMMNKRTINNIEQQQSRKQKIYKEPSSVYIAEETSFLSNSEEVNIHYSDETVLLSSTIVNPYLSRICGSGIERIDLTNSNFVIGRQNGVVNYSVEEQSIGRMHAEFIKKESQYFIKDLNTRNGTFLNEERLIGEQLMLLNSGDKIKLANIEFVFNLDQ